MHPQVIIPRRSPVWHPGLGEVYPVPVTRTIITPRGLRRHRCRLPFVAPPFSRIRIVQIFSAAIVQTPERNTASAGTNVLITYDTNPTAGNLLVAAYNASTGTTPPNGTVTSTNNTWTQAVFVDDTNFGTENGIFYCANCNGGAETVQMNQNAAGGGTARNMTVYEISGCATTSPLIDVSSGFGNPGPADPGDLITTTANAILIVHAMTGLDTLTAGTSYNMDTTGASFGFDYTQSRIVSSSGTYSAALAGTPAFWNASAAAFQEAAAGGATQQRLMMMGVGP